MKCQNDALPFRAFFMSLPQASAEAIFEISREIATAKPTVASHARKQFETLHPGISPPWVKDMMVNFGIQRPQPRFGQLLRKAGRSDGSRQDQIPRPSAGRMAHGRADSGIREVQTDAW
jgi:hypothetical protein